MAVVTSVVQDIAPSARLSRTSAPDTFSWTDDALLSWALKEFTEDGPSDALKPLSIFPENGASDIHDEEQSVCSAHALKSNVIGDSFISTKPVYGQLVWGKVKNNSRSWPAMVVRGEDCGQRPPNPGCSWLYWLGDRRISAVKDKYIEDFESNVAKYCRKDAPEKLLAGLAQAAKMIAEKRGVVFSREWSKEYSLQWVKLYFLEAGEDSKERTNDAFEFIDTEDYIPGTPVNRKTKNLQCPPRRPAKKRKLFAAQDPSSYVPDHVVKRLQELYALNEKTEKKKANEEELKKTETEERKSDELYQNRVDECSFVVDEADDNFCVSCGHKHYEALAQKHPWLKGYACEKCEDTITTAVAQWARIGFQFACDECGSQRAVLICPVPSCARIFCRPCSPNSTGFLCNQCENSEAVPAFHTSIRPDWRFKIWDAFYSLGRELTVKPVLRVLSLFDGIGTGLLVLDQLGLKIEKYYSSEVNSAAIAIVNAHFPGRVTHLGDIAQVTRPVLASLGPINLVIGGSPCNQLSRVNATAKGLLNVEGSGVLFFDFVRILRDLKALSQDGNVFWLFENVSSMRKDFRAIMSRSLECEPAVWNAADFSPQRRPRLFWGNIPGLHSTLADTSPQALTEVLTQGCYREASYELVNTITTNSNSQLQGRNAELPVVMDGIGDKLWITEVERIFGFPTHYTDIGNFSMTCRSELLGRAWSVPVLKKILHPLTRFFALREDIEQKIEV